MTSGTPNTPETAPGAPSPPKLKKALRGYDTAAVDKLLGETATSVQALTAERDRLRAEVESLDAELGKHRDAQQLMRDALVSAQRTANELTERTQAECDQLLERARAEAREIDARAQADREQAEADLLRLRAQEQELRASYRVLLAAALDRLEDSPGGETRPTASLLDALAPTSPTQRTTT